MICRGKSAIGVPRPVTPHEALKAPSAAPCKGQPAQKKHDEGLGERTLRTRSRIADIEDEQYNDEIDDVIEHSVYLVLKTWSLGPNQ